MKQWHEGMMDEALLWLTPGLVMTTTSIDFHHWLTSTISGILSNFRPDHFHFTCGILWYWMFFWLHRIFGGKSLTSLVRIAYWYKQNYLSLILVPVLYYSLFTNDMQRFSGNIFATGCCSLMGVSPLVLEFLYEYLLQSCRTVGLVLLEKLTENLCISLVNRL